MNYSASPTYTDEDNPVDSDLYTQYADVAVNDEGTVMVGFERHLIAEIGPYIPYVFSTAEDNYVYTEDNGLGHVIDDYGRHIKTIDLETGKTLYDFQYGDLLGVEPLESVTDQFGNTTRIERNGDSVPTAIISPDGLRTELTVDENNHLTRITFPDENYYGFGYSAEGLMETETDPAGNQFTHVFDDSDKVKDMMDENDGNWTYQRDDYSDGSYLITVSTAEGNQRTYLDYTDADGTYTSTITDGTGSETYFIQSGLVAEKTTSCGLEMAFEYDIDPEFQYKYISRQMVTTPNGLELTTTTEKEYTIPGDSQTDHTILTTTTVNGKSSTVNHDVVASEKVYTSPEGRTITTQYDPDTLTTRKISIPGFLDTDSSYDDQGRLQLSTMGDRQTEYRYNSDGFLETVIDPRENETWFVRDNVGRITTVQRPDGNNVYFDHDPNGNMTVLTTPVPADHEFDFNTVNLNTGYTPPLSGTYSFQFDKDRRPTLTTFPSGRTIETVYQDGLDRIDYISTPEGNIEYGYLCGSWVSSLTKGTESIAYTYDASLVTSESMSGTLNQSISYTYNDDFNLISAAYAGNTTDYSYDNDNLLTGSGNFTIGRNADNGLAESVSGDSLNISRGFSSYGETASLSQTVNGQQLVSWTLERNDNGRITTKTETVGTTATQYDYTYDGMGRLLTVTKDGELSEEYQYGNNGSRTYESNSLKGDGTSPFTRNLTYSDEDHLLTAGDVQFQYDSDGFLTTKSEGSEQTTYDYSLRGELLTVDLPDGTSIEYVHDPLGRRIAKKVNASITEKYLWQGQTRLLAVYDGSDNLLMRFEYADGRMPVAMTRSGTTYYLAYDQVGSLRAVVDSAGNVVKQINYDTFGYVVSDSDPDFEVPFGFAGGLYDKDTGQVRFGYRDYDPDVGRWTAKDPIFFNGGDTDFYGYALNDPINAVDPLGLWRVAFSFGFGVTGGIGWGDTFWAGSGSINFTINYDSNVGLYKSANLQLVEFEKFYGAYIGGGGQIGGEFSWPCDTPKRGYSQSESQYQSWGGGLGTAYEVFTTSNDNSIAGGGGRGPYGVGGYYGSGNAHNFTYSAY